MIKDEHRYEHYLQFNDVEIIDCQTCGYKHVYPFPSTEEINRFYQEKYYKEIKPFPYEQVNDEYIKKRIEQVIRTRSYSQIYNRVESYKQTTVRRMVDVGCGYNLLARYFQDREWEVSAIEPSKDAAAFLKMFELTVFNCEEESRSSSS